MTERDVIFPLLAISMCEACLIEDLWRSPKAEEVSHFFLARVVSDVFDLKMTGVSA